MSVTIPRPSLRERWSAWMSEIDAYYYGIRGWGLVLVLGGAVGTGWSLDQAAIQLEGKVVRGAGKMSVVVTHATTGELVVGGSLALPVVCAALCLALLLFARRAFGRVLAAFCGVGALAAVSIVALQPDKSLLSGFLLFWIATGAIALGACLCNVPPRVLARRGRTDDSFPA